jgi:AcrR family transcriptional regulator
VIVIFASFYDMNISEIGLEKGNKMQFIIEVAQRRFGMYGMEKTSMQEIANDLKLSKGSLYYYFPDKESLYKAVVQKEQNEFLARISEILNKIKEPDLLLIEYAKTRLSYFRTLLNLSRLRLESYSDLKPVFRESINEFKEKEKQIIKMILENGINLGIFTSVDTEKMASLYLDLLKGLRISVVNEKRTLFIEQDEYDRLFDITMTFTEIFIKGLSIK